MRPWSRPPVTLCTVLLLLLEEEGDEVIHMGRHHITSGSGGRARFSSPYTKYICIFFYYIFLFINLFICLGCPMDVPYMLGIFHPVCGLKTDNFRED